jgi:hypothetical protein
MPSRPIQRLRLADFMVSRGPTAVGYCNADVAPVGQVVNEAQQRLLFAGGETGWYGSWWKMVFNLTQDDPYITAPREVARLINMDVCRTPIRIQNEFYEFLEAGIGLQPLSPSCRGQLCATMEAHERGSVISQRDLTPGNKKLRVVITDPADVGRTCIVQGKDQNGSTIYGQNGTDQILGTVLDLTLPFVDTPTEIAEWDGFQKDFTIGPVSVYEVDFVTGDQVLLATYAPNELVPSYRRYLVNGLPQWCCKPTDPTTGIVQVTAMAKLEFVPVQVPEDYLLIQNIPALIEEVQAVRYDGMDTDEAKKLSEYHHARAIRYLNGQLEHYYGKLRPAIQFSPFGTATLRRQQIGAMM